MEYWKDRVKSNLYFKTSIQQASIQSDTELHNHKGDRYSPKQRGLEQILGW